MANPADVEATKAARRALGKRGIDISGADVRVSHGVCHVRGVLQALKGAEIEDVRAAVEQVAVILRKRPDIREVAIDAAFRGV